MKITITRIRKSILDFINTHHSEHGYMPTVREIGASIGQNNLSVVQYHLEKLQSAGLVQRDGKNSRGISVILGDEIFVVDSRYENSKGKRRSKRIPISKEIEMLDYFNGCAYCGDISNSYHKDHFFPFADGGGEDANNILLACPKCNYSKGAKSPVKWVIDNFGIDRLEKIVAYLHTR